MLLRAWIAEEKLTLEAAALRIGVAAKETVRRYGLPADHPDHRLPERDTMRRIFVESRGRVQPNDFYDLPDLNQIGAPFHGATSGGRSPRAAGSCSRAARARPAASIAGGGR